VQQNSRIEENIMKPIKGLQRIVMAAAVAVLAFGAAPAKAMTNDSFGSCVGIGAGASDCVTTNGHISASVVGTLSINEMRAVSFGNFAVTCTATPCLGDATLALDPTGVRVSTPGVNDTIILLNGANATGGAPAGDPGSQSPGHYTVSAAKENGTTQVYVSFADNLGNIIDACSPHNSTGGVFGGADSYTGAHGTCDVYHPGHAVTLTGPTANAFTVDQFVFNESGSDVYGHYINNGAAVGPGGATPFLPGTGAANTGHNGTPATGTPAGVGAVNAIDVVVGATLHTTASAVAPLPGKYTSTYEVMVSY
jgi:hypothetical protein